MRLDPKLVHPSILKAAEGAFLRTGSASPDAVATAAHNRVWVQEYGEGCAAFCIFGGALLFAALYTSGWLRDGLRLLPILGAIALIVVVGMIAYRRNLRHMAVPELAVLLPILDLTESQRAVGEALVAIEGSGQPRETVEETMATLNALLDEEDRLLEVRRRLDAARPGDVALEREREGLLAALAGASDEGTRDAYAQSILLLDERAAAAQAGSGARERIEAHLALLRQTVLATRDDARRLSAGPAESLPALETDSLRAALASARAQTLATEQALAELRAI